MVVLSKPALVVISVFDCCEETSRILNSKLTLRSLMRINGIGAIVRIGTVSFVSCRITAPGFAGSGRGWLKENSAVRTDTSPVASSSSPTFSMKSMVVMAAKACALMTAVSGVPSMYSSGSA